MGEFATVDNAISASRNEIMKDQDLTQPPLSSSGRHFHAGYALPLAVLGGSDDRNFNPSVQRFAVMHVQRGGGLLKVKGVEVPVSTSHLLLFDESTRPEVIKSADLHYRMVYFHPETINGVFDFSNLRAGLGDVTISVMQDRFLLEAFLDTTYVKLVLSPAVHAQVERMIQQMADEAEVQKDWNWPCRTRSFLIELLFTIRLHLENKASLTVSPVRDASPLDLAMQLVHERFCTTFTVKELAYWCASNRTSINTYFRQKTGHSLKDYIISLRLNMAADLLRDTLLPIAEIVNRCGYNNTSHFSRIFLKKFGLPPSHYRKQEGWMS